MQSTCDGDPALVCERCDDKSGSGTHILIAVVESGLDLSDGKWTHLISLIV